MLSIEEGPNNSERSSESNVLFASSASSSQRGSVSALGNLGCDEGEGKERERFEGVTHRSARPNRHWPSCVCPRATRNSESKTQKYCSSPTHRGGG